MNDSRWMSFEQHVLGFWSKVQKGKGCWEWRGCLDSKGYGSFAVAPGKAIGSHRVSWFLTYGIWPTRDLDHKCRNPLCVRTSHLRDVTRSTNILARPVSQICRRGHPLRDPNLYYYNSTKFGKRRRCLACMKETGTAPKRYLTG